MGTDKQITSGDGASGAEQSELVVRQALPDGEAGRFRSFAGMSSHTTIQSGQLESTMSAPDIGRPSDFVVVERVVAVLRGQGHVVARLAHSDEHGEDGRIRLDSADVVIQVVGVPASQDFFREARQSSAYMSETVEQATARVEEAVMKKAGRYPPTDKASMLLAVDCRALGSFPTVSNPSTTLCTRSGFAAIWLVGSLNELCQSLPGSRW